MNGAGSHGTLSDPYRIFFPLGAILGIAGASIWVLYYLGITETYSGRSHAFVQVEGFLYSFIVGFLLTAVPKFTGTDNPSRRAKWLLAGVLLSVAIAFESRLFMVGHSLFLVAHAILITLLVTRFRKRTRPAPDTFAFVGAGLLAGAFGGLINASIDWGWIGPEWDLLGRRMMTEGMVLLLVLGVGGFLGPRLLGFAALPDFQSVGELSQRSRPPLSVRYGIALNALAAASILFALILEYGNGLGAFAFVRAGIATAVVFTTIKPWKLPAVRTTLAWCVWGALWLLIAGLWLIAAAPKYRADFLHVIFIGGFSLLILAVGMRVTLSHGGHSLAPEKRSWPLRIGVGTLIVAMLARVGAPFAPNSFFEHLAFAAILWIAGVAFWQIRLLVLTRGR